MSDTSVPILKPGTYKHYKGNLYTVLGVGRHTEQDDFFVVYSPVEQKEGMPGIWLRPYEMFIETVGVAGEIKPRFEYIDDMPESDVVY